MDSQKDPLSAAPETSSRAAAPNAEGAEVQRAPAPTEEGSAHTLAPEAPPSDTHGNEQNAAAAPAPEGAAEEDAAESAPPVKNDAGGATIPLAGLSKPMLLALALFIAVIALAGYRIYSYSLSSAPAQVTAGAQVNLPEVVARVNGVAITREELLRQLAQTKAFLASMGPQGAPQDEEVLRGAVMDDLINGELLYQAAADSGVSVTDEEVAQEFENAKASMASEEDFQSQLSSLGHTEETFRLSLRKQMTINRYLTDKVQFSDITVPEEESRALYQQFFSQSEGNADVPSFEEVKPQIENELRNQKARTKVQEIIDTLRQEAKIETLL